ncbi:MAG: UPF0489 family protein, partial [Spirochaetota bacterium]
MYETPFYIETPVSNNAFSYERRLSEKGEARIFVPALICGTYEDIRPGKEIVFEEYDGDSLRSCTGLESFVLMRSPFNSAPVYVFDNHNHAFSFWGEQFCRKGPRRSILVHIDQHKDTRCPDQLLFDEDRFRPDKIFLYANTVLNVGNFIPPALKAGFADDMFFIGSEDAIDSFSADSLSGADLLLDIDLDFFAPELDYIPAEKKIECIRSLMKKAS